MIQQGMSEKSLAALAENPGMFDRLISELREAFPKSFSPRENYRSIHAHITNILDTLKFVPASWPAKILLSSLYGLILLVSLGLVFLFLAANIHEQLKDTRDATLIDEAFAFHAKASETPLNRDLLYDGVATVFGKDTNTITGHIEYAKGYRVGWTVQFGPQMDTTEISYYTAGRLDSIVSIDAGKRTVILARNRNAFKRLASWIIYASQPFKSNHKLFRD